MIGSFLRAAPSKLSQLVLVTFFCIIWHWPSPPARSEDLHTATSAPIPVAASEQGVILHSSRPAAFEGQAAMEDLPPLEAEILSDPPSPPLPSADMLAMRGDSQSEKAPALPDQPTGNTGAYSFSIPIHLPEGPRGVKPSVSLSYSTAGAKQGELGSGWSLNAGSIIERKGGAVITSSGELRFPGGAPRFYDSREGDNIGDPPGTPPDQGSIGTQIVNGVYNDSFYLDGIRLIDCQGRTDIPNCPDGVYATEYGFDRAIHSEAPDTALMSSWNVAKKDGSTWYYNKRRVANINTWNSDSFLEVSQWHLTSVLQDGVSIVYSYYDEERYENDPDPAPTGLKSITYGPWEVSFEWEDRPEPGESYRSGTRVALTKRLKAIEITRSLSSDPTQRRIRRYDITYEQSQDSGLSLVKLIQESGHTDSPADKMPPYTFSYTDPSDKGWDESTKIASGLADENRFVSRFHLASDTLTRPQGLQRGVQAVDINGDAHLDLLRNQYETYWQMVDGGWWPAPSVNQRGMWLGNADLNWRPQNTSSIAGLDTVLNDMPFSLYHNQNGPYAWYFDAPNHASGHAHFTDLNGDGAVDAITSTYNQAARAYFKTPTGFIEEEQGVLGPNPSSFSGSLQWHRVFFDYLEPHGPTKAHNDYPYDPNSNVRTDAGVSILDVNGDNLPDIVSSRCGDFPPDYPADTQSVYLNTGRAFNPVAREWLRLPDPEDPLLLYGAYNFYGASWHHDWSTQSTTEDPAAARDQCAVERAEFTTPTRVFNVSRGKFFADLNGDSLPDMLRLLRVKYKENRNDEIIYGSCSVDPYQQADTGQEYEVAAWINNAHGWDYSPAWTAALQALATQYDFALDELNKVRVNPQATHIPSRGRWDQWYNHPQGTAVADVNGDGLEDLVQHFCEEITCQTRIARAFLNTGSGFVRDDAWAPPEPLTIEVSGHYKYVRFTDVPAYGGVPEECYAPRDSIAQSFDTGVQLIDIDSDGLPDLLANTQLSSLGDEMNWSFTDSPRVFAMKNRVRFDRDLISSITTPEGGTISLTYTLSSEGSNNPHLPSSRVLVDTITSSNGRSGSAEQRQITRLQYYGGQLVDGKFAGYRMVSIEKIVDDDTSLFTTNWYLNDDANYCRLQQIQHSIQSERLCDSQGCLYNSSSFEPTTENKAATLRVHSLESNFWDSSCPTDKRGPFFSPPFKTTHTEYDPKNPALQKSWKSHQYFDSYGNVYLKQEFNSLTNSQPDRSVSTAYTTPYLSLLGYDLWFTADRPCFRVTYANGIATRLDRTAYDDAPIGNLCEPIIGWGRVTREETEILEHGQFSPVSTQSRSYYYNGNLKSTTDSRGNVTDYTWNDQAFGSLYLTKVISPQTSGQDTRLTREYLYNPYGLLEATVDTNNQSEERYEYDGLSRLTRQYTRTTGGSTTSLPEISYQYINTGNPDSQYVEVSVKTNEGVFARTRTYTDGARRVYLSEQPDAFAGNVRVFSQYNLHGLPAFQSLPYTGTGLNTTDGTQYFYDALGRETKRILPGGYVHRTDYGLSQDSEGTVYSTKTLTAERGDTNLVRHLLFDSFERLVKVSECASGDCSDPFSSGAYLTTYRYDPSNNLTLTCMSDGGGNCANPATSKTRHFFDGLGRLTATKDADISNCPDTNLDDSLSGCPVRNFYDAAGNLELTQDSKTALGLTDGTTTSMDYDELNRLITKRSFRGAPPHINPEFTSNYLYDAIDTACPLTQTRLAGRLSSESQIRGDATQSEVYRCYSYDAAGRIDASTTRITLPGRTPEEVFSEYEYSPFGSPTLTTVRRAGVSYTISFHYNRDGSLNLIQSNIPRATTLASDLVYNELGALVSYALGNGTHVTRSFRTASSDTPMGDRRLGKTTLISREGTGLLSLVFDYDPVGNIHLIWDSSLGQLGYTYDNLNRLIEVRKNNEIQEEYQYNSLGNRTLYSWRERIASPPRRPDVFPIVAPSSEKGTSTTKRALPGSYIVHSRITTFGRAFQGLAGTHAPKEISAQTEGAKAAFSESLLYDANGNLTEHSDLLKGITTHYKFNHDDKLISVNSPSSSIEYFYGPKSEKIAVSENGEVTYKIDSMTEIVRGKLSLNLSLEGKALATYNSDEGIRYSFTDHLGSVRRVLDGEGRPRKSLSYKPFGEISLQNGDRVRERRNFNGNNQDLTGILDYNARSYDPKHGVFLQADSLIPDRTNPQSLNRYSYVMNNPLNYVDPSGHVTRRVGDLDGVPLYEDSGVSVTADAGPDQKAEDGAKKDSGKGDSPGLLVRLGGRMKSSLMKTFGGGSSIPKGAKLDSPEWKRWQQEELAACSNFAMAGCSLGASVAGSAGALVKNAVEEATSPQAAGRAWEALRRAKGDINGPRDRFVIEGRKRISDGTDFDAKIMHESKGGKSPLSLTLQIRDYLTRARDLGVEFRLHVREGVHISEPLRQALAEHPFGAKILEYLD